MTTPARRFAVDFLTMAVVLAVGVFASWAVFAGERRLGIGATVVLTLIAVGGAYTRIVSRPDHLQALQSHQILEIANESLAHLRKGLDAETAAHVCRFALAESEAHAIAITDRETVLGFVGLGEDHHATAGPILTRATREALEHNEPRILLSAGEIGCPKADCLLKAAIVVPLEVRGIAVGTLKFYYTTSRLITETQITMVEGLAKLLSTQLELSELDRQTQLACRMELKALQAQINPHFLFNTINTIAMLIRTEPVEARRLLREFATFYRRTLEAPDELITLERELEYVRTYLEFEHARFGDRIRYHEEVAPGSLSAQVPGFILQPIVENAIQHGIPPAGALRISMSAASLSGVLLVDVHDDGVGMDRQALEHALEPGFGNGLGIGLANVNERLKGFFGPASGLSIESTEGKGTTVRLTITSPHGNWSVDAAQSAHM